MLPSECWCVTNTKSRGVKIHSRLDIRTFDHQKICLFEYFFDGHLNNLGGILASPRNSSHSNLNMNSPMSGRHNSPHLEEKTKITKTHLCSNTTCMVKAPNWLCCRKCPQTHLLRTQNEKCGNMKSVGKQRKVTTITLHPDCDLYKSWLCEEIVCFIAVSAVLPASRYLVLFCILHLIVFSMKKFI